MRVRTRKLAALLAWTTAAFLAAGCGGEGPRPRNLVLISLDTVRADHIGAYGRAGAGTPVVDALARGGVRFSDAMAPAPLTLPSHATIFTGADPLRHGVRHNRLFTLSDRALTLAERMAAAGFRTGAFTGSVVLAERTGLGQGFERYSSPRPGGAPGLFFLGERPATEVNRDAIAWLEEIGDAPFLLFVHYMEAHAPYEPPEPARSQHPGDAYQGEVATADRALGELLGWLKQRGRLADTLTMVVADHGEALREHGEVTHGIFVYQSTLHVPFVAAGPGIPPDRVIEEPVGLVDVTPTVLDAFGLEVPPDLDGRSLWPVMTGTGPAPVRPLYAESFAPRYDFGWSELRALRSGPYKVIAAPRPELYALASDPDETHDRADEEPERLAELTGELERRVARIEGPPGSAPRDTEAERRVGVDPEEGAALEALGYLSGAHAADGAGARPDPKDVYPEAIKLEAAGRLMRAGRTEAAERVLRDLLAGNPAFIEARVRLIVARVLDGDMAEAEAESVRLAESARRLPDGERVAARGFLLTARAYLDAGQLADAARQLERAAALGEAEAVTLLAAVYRDLGRSDDADALLERGRTGDPGGAASRAAPRQSEGGGSPPSSSPGKR